MVAGSYLLDADSDEVATSTPAAATLAG